MNLEQLRRINRAENIVVTAHGRKRMSERGILLREVMEAISRGEIIEQYPEDYPFPSCLILGFTINGRCIHAVISTDAELIYLITAYEPNPEEWESDMKTRKGSKK